MDHQITQAEQVLANFSSFRQEQSEDMLNFTQQITNEMTQIDERFTSNQQETQQSLEKQKLELKQLIENLANNQQLLQQSLEQQAKDTDNIAAKAKARYIRLTVITVIGFLILGILLIVT
ncbi:hypothetical protein GX865_06870 [Candidatus Saccharibacteria bacterium]|nr:hypothetical protein [Candidatus Saccharibacteria bacterium]